MTSSTNLDPIEELKQLLDKIIVLIESDMMRGVVAGKVVQLVAEHHRKIVGDDE